MNKIFKVIWNTATQSWVAVSELQKAKGKSKSVSSGKVLFPLVLGSGLLIGANNAFSAVAIGSTSTTGATTTVDSTGATVVGDAIAIGTNSNAKEGFAIGTSAVSTGGNGSIALGFRTQATGVGSFALGTDSIASGRDSVAFGSNVSITGNNSVGISSKANVTGNNAIAIGANSSALANRVVAIGFNAIASETTSIALGYNATSSGRYSNALGSNANVSGENATGIGTNVTASAEGANAIGLSANASGVNSYALGKGANATALATYALGENANAIQDKAIAIGSASKSSGEKSIAIGDSANASNTHAFALGGSSSASGLNSIALGSNSNTTGNYAVAIGNAAKSSAQKSLSMGTDSNASANYSTAVGANSTASGANSFAGGYLANASADNAVALGKSANATKGSAVAIGNEASVSELNSVAIGYKANSTAQNAASLGREANSTANYALALGANSQATLERSVAIGSYSTTSTAVQNPNDTFNGITYNFAGGTPAAGDVVSVGSADRKRQIQNVAAGQISDVSTDAINGSQLYSVITESHWKLQANGAAVGDVNFGDKVNFKSADGSVTITPTAEAGGVSTLDLQIKRGLGITLDSNGALAVANTALDQSATTMRFSTPRGQQDKFVKADDLARHLNNVGFKLSGEAQAGTFEDLTASDAEKQLRTGDTLTMIAGPNVKINQVNKGFEFLVEGENVAYAGNKATVPTTDEGYVATVKSVAEAINHSGFTLKTSAATGGEKVSGADEVINPADIVDMTAGKNLTVKQDANGKITYATKDDVTFTNVTASNVTTGGTSISNAGLKAGDITVTNKPITVNGAPVNNVNDAINQTATQAFSPLTFAGDSGNNVERKLGTTLNVKGGVTDSTKLSNGNIGVVANGNDTLDIKLAKELTDINSIAINNGPTINGDGINMANNPITNISNNLINATNGLRDLNNNTVDDKTAATVGDLRNMGWVVSSNKTTGTTAGSPTEIEFTKNVKNANEVRFVGTGIAKVSGATDADGKNVITVHVDETSTPTTSNITADASGQIGVKNDDNTINTNPTTNPNNLATANDVVNAVNNAFWKVFEADTTTANKKDDVKAGDNVVFANGTGTTANVTSDGTTTTVKYSVKTDDTTIKVDEQGNITANTGDLTNNATTGVVNTPNTEDGKKLTTAADVAEAINNSGFRVKSAGDNKAEGDEAAERLVKTGELVEFEAGDNLTVKRVGGKFTYATKQDVGFNKVTSNTIEVPTGTATTDKPITISKDGIDMANKPITNINNGLQTYNDAPKTGLVDLTKPTTGGVSDSTAATVGDLRNMGWVVSSDKTTGALGNAYTDQVKNANEVKFVGTNLATVSGKTVDGVRTITVDVNTQNVVETAQLPVVYTKADGTKVYKQPDGSFNTKADGTGDKVEAGDVIASMNSGNNSTTAPTTLSNIAGNLDGAKTDTTAPTTKADKPTTLNNNNAATVGDVLNAGWNLQVTGNPASTPADVDFVSPYDSVNFKAGTGVLLGHESNGKASTITISLAGDNGALRASDGSTMTGNPLGRIEVVENPTGMVNAGNVANMINKSGFSTTATLVMPNGDRFEGEESLINPGDQVNYVDGKNTKANVTVEKVAVPVTTFWVTETVNGKDQKVQVEPTKVDANGEVIEAVYAAGSSKAGQPVDLTSADKLKIEKQIESVEHDKFDVSYDVVTGETEVPTTGDNKGKAAVSTDAVNNALQAAKDELETAKQGGDQTAIEAAQAKVDAAQKAVDGINNAVATVGDIVETINNVAWYTNSTTATGSAADTAIKAGGRVNLEAGKNIEVTQTVDAATNTVSYTYSTKEEVDFNKITVSNGDNLVDGEGNKVTAEKDPVTGATVYKNEAGDVVNAADVKPANTVNLANEAGKAVTNAATGQDASKPAPSALNITGTDAAGNASPTQITGVASTLNTKAVETSPAGKDQPKGLDNLVDLKGDANNPVNPTSAATVGDLQNMGWVVSASGNEYKDTVKNANEVKFVGEGRVNVTGETKDGVREIKVAIKDQVVDGTERKNDVVNYDNGSNTVANVNDVYNYKPSDTEPAQELTKKADGNYYDKAGNVVNNVDQNKLTPVGYAVSYDVVTGETEVPTTGDNKGKATVTGAEPANTALQAAKNELETAKAGNDQTAIDAAQAKVDAAQKAVDSINNAVATVGDIVETINNVAWYTNSTTATGGAEDTAIKSGGHVNLEAGKNIEVTQTVDKDTNTVSYTYSTKEEVDFNKVTVSTQAPVYTNQAGDELVKQGDKYFTKDGNVEVPANEVITTNPNAVNLTTKEGAAVNNAGTNQTTANKPNELNIAGNNDSLTQITGVGSTLNTTAIDIAPQGDETAQVNGKAPTSNLVDLANATTPTSAATVGDLQNMGWVVSASGNEYKDTVKNANEVKFVGTNLAKVTGETDGQGVRTITVDVNTQNVVENAQLPVVYTNAQGDKIYKQVDAQGNVTFNTKPDGTGDVVQPGDVIASMNSGSNSTVAPTTLANVASNLAPTTSNANGDLINKDGTDGKSADSKPTTSQAAPTNAKGINNNAATVGDVLNAGWNLQGNGEAKDFVKPYDTVNFVDGKGTKAVVESDGTTSTIKVDIDNGTITANDNGSVIGPVTDAQKAVDDAKKALETDPNNQTLKDDLAKAEQNLANVGNQVATAQNVADAINKSGFNLKTSATTEGSKSTDGTANNGELIKPSDTVEMIAGKNLTIKQDKDGKVTYATKDDVNFNSVQFGDISPKITNDGSNIKVSDKDGKATKITNVANGTAPTDAVNFSQLQASREEVKSDDKSVTVTTTQNAAGANVFDVSVNVDGTTITKDPTTGAIKANTANLNVANDGNIDVPTNGDENKLITAGEVAQTVNNVSWNVDSEEVGNGVVEGDRGPAKVKAGSTVKVNAGNNIKVTRKVTDKGTDMTVSVSDNPEFNTVKVGKGKDATTISSNEDGVRIAKADGSPQRITNVAAGRADTDAVNVGQLKGAVTNLNNKINRNNREARAGIAGSNAAAALPQVYIPGKSMVAAAGGTFKGENALAVGYSRSSDNGKLILKLQGNANSRGDIGAGVGVGYQW